MSCMPSPEAWRRISRPFRRGLMPRPSGPVRWCPRPVSPAVCPLRKIFGVLADHAKRWPVGACMTHQLSTWSTTTAPNACRATDFRIDIISLYIEVDAAVVGYRLDLYVQLAGLILSLTYFRPLPWAVLPSASPGFAPEVCRAVKIVGPAIDDKPRQFTFVHYLRLRCVVRRYIPWAKFGRRVLSPA